MYGTTTLSGALLLSSLVSLGGFVRPAHARPHRTHRRVDAPRLTLRPAPLDAYAGARIAPPAPLTLVLAPSYFEDHARRVRYDMVRFGTIPKGPLPLTPPRRTGLNFSAPAGDGDTLAMLREQDRLLLFRGSTARSASSVDGVLLFITATVASAHAPAPLRVIFDGPIHVGPALLIGGAMGAGIGGPIPVSALR